MIDTYWIKPDRIDTEIWEQHIQWHRVLDEGQLTKDPSLRLKKTIDIDLDNCKKTSLIQN